MDLIAKSLMGSYAKGPIDPYFEYTTLLLSGNGLNGAQNGRSGPAAAYRDGTFLDGSTNNFTITRNGNTTQGTFSPFSQTGWGNYFNGSSDLSAGTTLFNYTTGNASTTTFTIEAFVYLNSYQSAAAIYHNPCIIGKGDIYLNLGVNGSGNLFVYHFDGTIRSIIGSSVIPLATWTYVALTVSGGTATLYVNGTSVGSGTWYGIQAAGQNTTSLIGRASTNFQSLYINGYISNLRVSTVVRTIATPTTAYTNDANTALLTAQSNRFIDNSSSPITLTVTGSPTVVAFSPFNPTASWSAATYGGSGYFDGSGDYLTAAQNAAFNLGTAAFTVEAWINLSALPSPANGGIITLGNGAASSGPQYCGWGLWVMTNGTIVFERYDGTEVVRQTSTTITLNQWNHIVAVRDSSSNFAIFINGVRGYSAASATTSYNNVNSNLLYVGRTISGAGPTTNYLTGYIGDVRVVAGTAVYSATSTTLTVPTAPLTAITNTQLLLNFTNAGIYDATAKNDLETVGNAQISNTTAKWGSTSIKFDGTGDYLIMPPSPVLEFGGGDFTIEFWFYSNSISAYQTLIERRSSVTVGGLVISIYLSAVALNVGDANTGSWEVGIAGSSLSSSTWYHVACTRSGSSWKMFVNGTQQGGTATWSGTPAFETSALRIAGDASGANALNGYMQDIRITKGYARYTANFTPPTAAFPTL